MTQIDRYDTMNYDSERDKLAIASTLDIICYVKESIEILMNMKLE